MTRDKQDKGTQAVPDTGIDIGASAQASAELPEKAFLRIAADQVLDAAETRPVAVDPDLAAYMGAFEEDALDEEDALMSLFDGAMPADSGEDD